MRKLILILWTIALFAGFALMSSWAYAAVEPAQAIRAIIGEASDQGELGMTAVAEAIRNRGHLKGVYGLNAEHVDKEPAWVWEMAQRAWESSVTSNLVQGADHWHNVNREGPNYWTRKMTETARIGSHVFYKER